MEKIAILLTCHNRKDKTISCLKSLYKAIEFANFKIKFDVFLVDDGSSDGTSEEITLHFSEINIIKGSGQLFWAGGMRLAWETALNENQQYDSFLLLNDDVILNEDFVIDLLKTHHYCLENYNQSGIYVSSTTNMIKSKISYGGILIKNKGIRLELVNINPGDVPARCSITNANILMVTASVVDKIGILDSKYTHQIADYDYTYNASKIGIPVLVCPGIGGTCDDDHGKSWLPSSSTLKDRIHYLYSPTGLAYKEKLYYLKKNFKYQFPYYFVMLWLKTIFPLIWEKLKKEKVSM